MIEILRTDCAKCKVAPAVILLKAKLYCAKCAVAIHYAWNNEREPKRRDK